MSHLMLEALPEQQASPDTAGMRAMAKQPCFSALALIRRGVRYRLAGRRARHRPLYRGECACLKAAFLPESLL